MIEAVLFDVDGTLIDSNDAHTRAWEAAFREAGYDVGFERIRPLIGMGGDRLLPACVDGLSEEAEPGKTIARRRGEIFKERELGAIRAQAGAKELLGAVRSGGTRVVVATSAKAGELSALLGRGDLEPLVDVASTSDDAATSKPAPDIVHAALRKARIDAAHAVYVGDTRWDVEAAHRAGMPCIVLRCGGATPAELQDADAAYDDPAALTAALRDGSFAWPIAVSTAT